MSFQHCCGEMARHVQSGDVGIRFLEKFREYGIAYLDGGTAIQRISFCPWCGHRLAGSLREEWFDEIHRLGLEPDDDGIPVRYRTAEWYADRN